MYTRTPDHQPLSEFYITMPELPSHTAVMQHADSKPRQRKSPRWARACVWAGSALSVASGAVLIALEALS